MRIRLSVWCSAMLAIMIAGVCGVVAQQPAESPFGGPLLSIKATCCGADGGGSITFVDAGGSHTFTVPSAKTEWSVDPHYGAPPTGYEVSVTYLNKKSSPNSIKRLELEYYVDKAGKLLVDDNVAGPQTFEIPKGSAAVWSLIARNGVDTLMEVKIRLQASTSQASTR